jgi:hypothetical protein
MGLVDQLEDSSLSQAVDSQIAADTGGGQVHAEVVGGPGGDTPPASSVLKMSADGQATPEERTASEHAYGASHPAAAAKKKQSHAGGTNSHNGGFTGFGAEYDPYSYTGHPNIDHGKLDPKLAKLGVQHTRIFVPWNAVTTGLLGKAGPDLEQQHIDQLTQLLDQDPNNDQLKKRLAAAQKQYAQDKQYTQSFEKTVALAGKQTTINLTFMGAVDQPARAKEMAHIIKYFADQGYGHLQTTLENEPNGGTAKGTGYRSDWNRAAAAHNKPEMAAAAKRYVDAYQNLTDELKAIGARDDVKVVGGDMVGQRRAEFFHEIVQQGLNKYVDAYSLHVYWGTGGHTLENSLAGIKEMQQLAKKIAPGKSMEITEFGRKQGGLTAAPRNEESAFEEGLFALSAVNDGYTGLVKWDAFYAPTGDGKGQPGKFYEIAGPKQHYSTDAMYALMRMFTHAVEPGWRAEGTNHGTQGAQCTFRSPDGEHGAVLAMSRSGGAVSTAGLPKHAQLHAHVWKNGHLQTMAVPHGGSVDVPAMGAVAVSTKSF